MMRRLFRRRLRLHREAPSVALHLPWRFGGAGLIQLQELWARCVLCRLLPVLAGPTAALGSCPTLRRLLLDELMSAAARFAIDAPGERALLVHPSLAHRSELLVMSVVRAASVYGVVPWPGAMVTGTAQARAGIPLSAVASWLPPTLTSRRRRPRDWHPSSNWAEAAMWVDIPVAIALPRARAFHELQRRLRDDPTTLDRGRLELLLRAPVDGAPLQLIVAGAGSSDPDVVAAAKDQLRRRSIMQLCEAREARMPLFGARPRPIPADVRRDLIALDGYLMCVLAAHPDPHHLRPTWERFQAQGSSSTADLVMLPPFSAVGAIAPQDLECGVPAVYWSWLQFVVEYRLR
jgi:hypothetical protein